MSVLNCKFCMTQKIVQSIEWFTHKMRGKNDKELYHIIKCTREYSMPQRHSSEIGTQKRWCLIKMWIHYISIVSLSCDTHSNSVVPLVSICMTSRLHSRVLVSIWNGSSAHLNVVSHELSQIIKITASAAAAAAIAHALDRVSSKPWIPCYGSV